MADKLIIQTDKAPKAIGPYSQGVSVSPDRMFFFSGQIALDAESGEVVGEDTASQTRKVMQNIEALLISQGLTFENIVKTTVFLQDMNDFATVNEIYATYFKSDPPARSAVEVSRLPKNVLVEVEVVAAN